MGKGRNKTKYVHTLLIPKSGARAVELNTLYVQATRVFTYDPEAHAFLNADEDVARETLVHFLQSQGFYALEQSSVGERILEMAFRLGPLRGSYVYRLDAILDALITPWGERKAGLTAFMTIVDAGFHYKKVASYRALTTSLRSLAGKQISHEGDHKTNTVRLGFCYNVLQRCHEARIREIPDAFVVSEAQKNHPGLPALAARIWLQLPGTGDVRAEVWHASGVIHLGSVWSLLGVLLGQGMTIRQLERLADHNASAEFVLQMGALMLEQELEGHHAVALLSSRQVQRELCKAGTDGRREYDAWVEAGRPSDIEAFFLDCFQCASGAPPITSQPTPQPTAPEQLILQTSESREAAPTSDTKIDFDWIMAELDLTEAVDELDEVEVRAILVHGFIRHGDRVCHPSRIVSRDVKRLWRQCREHFGSKQELTACVDGLLRAEVLVSDGGGRYVLNTKAQASMSVRALVERLKSLAGSYAT